jgi:hypothetical protein
MPSAKHKIPYVSEGDDQGAKNRGGLLSKFP